MPQSPTFEHAKSPIDLNHLSQYTADDPALTRDILGLFDEQMHLWMAALKAATTASAWHQVAHKMKGGARGVGAFDLARLAEDAEALGDAPEDTRLAMIVQLGAEMTRTRAYVQQLLSDSPLKQ